MLEANLEARVGVTRARKGVFAMSRLMTRTLGQALFVGVAMVSVVGLVMPASAGAASIPTRISADWAQYRFGSAHTGFTPYENVLSPATVGGLVQLWQSRSHEASFSSPAVVGGVVYVGSQAFDATTGALLWDAPVPGDVAAAPAVQNGIDYVRGYQGLYALDAATGARLWHKTVDYGAASPTIEFGWVYIAGSNSVSALNASTGHVRWTTATGGTSYSAPSLSKGTLFVGSADNLLYALDARTGAIEWTYATPGQVFATPAVTRGVVYAGTASGRVIALDARTGALVWSQPLGDRVYAAVAVARGGTVFASSQDKSVYALRATSGKIRWSFATAGMVDGPPTVANGVVYVGSDDGTFYALDSATGASLWSVSIPNARYRSSPAVVDGRLYVGTYYDERVHAFGLPEEVSAR